MCPVLRNKGLCPSGGEEGELGFPGYLCIPAAPVGVIIVFLVLFCLHCEAFGILVP